MMSTTKLTMSLLPLLALVACGLPGGDDADKPADGSEGTGSMPAEDSGTSGGADDDDDDGATAADDTTTGSDDPTTGADPANDCSEATLFMGNPYYDGDLTGWNAAGQGLFDDPPLRSRHLAASGANVAIETQREVWVVDGAMVRRIAGDEDEPEQQYQPSGACEDVRLVIGSGMAGLPNGNLVVTDIRGNGVIELSDPLGNCTASPIAGNPDPTLDVNIDGTAADGDVDGPGAQARFSGVERPIAAPDGSVFLVDTGNGKIKRIAADADRTVSTVVDLGGDEKPLGMTVLDGKLFVSGSTGAADFLWAVDPATGTRDVLFSGTGLFDEIDSTKLALMATLTHDGADLIVLSTQGYVFRVSQQGEPLGVIAGYGSALDFPEIDITQPIPVGELPIRSFTLNDGALLRHGNDILVGNVANGVGFHVWSISCQ